MPILFIYFLKLSVAFSIVYLFYVVALRRLTFYNWNRWYLLLYTGLCFLFPLIDIGSLFSSTTEGSNRVIAFVPTLSDFNKNVDVSNTATSFFTVRNAIAAVLLGGMVFLFGRLLIQLYSYSRMAKKATLVSVKGIRVYETDLSTLPFSFGRYVFINTQQHTEEELAEIIKHEFVHVKQMHTIDVLWGELLCIVNWYNPFAWLIRNAIRQNLEFIADDKVLQEGIDKTQYQYLLLKVTGNKQYSIAPSFNFSSLKKRIAMMNKSKTAKLQLMRFLFLLPVVAVLLLVFRKETSAQELSANKKQIEESISKDTVAPVKVTEVTLVPLPQGLLNYPKDVKNLLIKGDSITVFMQDGKKEQYDLKDEKQKQALEKKYGKMPSLSANKKKVEESISKDTVTLVPLPQGLLNYPKDVKDVLIKGDIITVFMQDGKKEQYDLKDEKQKQALEKKYGKMPSLSAPATKLRYYKSKDKEKVSSDNQTSDSDTLQPIWYKWPGLSTNLTRVPVYSNWQQWDENTNMEDRDVSFSGEAPFSMKGTDRKGISYVEPTELRKKFTINKAIITAESISVTSKNHSLNLKGEASFKNNDGVAMYAAIIQLSLKDFSGLPYVLIDNKELDWDKDYSNNYKQTYEVSFLKKEDAMSKYGEKGKEGALEITSL